MGKWIDFEDSGTTPTGKTRRWNVVSNTSGHILGTIYWWSKWRQYVFEPIGAARIIFEEDCLRDIAIFIENRTAEHKEMRRANARGGD